MLFIVAVWFVFLPFFIGIGLLAFSFFPQNKLSFQIILLQFWTGFCLVIAILQVWQLFFPVNTVPLLIFLAVSLAGWWNSRADIITNILPRLRSMRWYDIALNGFIVLLAAMWVANRCLRAPLTYDTPLYHWPMTIWFSKYPIVVGLANINERFGFNSSYFLYTALLDIGPLVNKSMFVTNGLLAFTLLLYILSSIQRLIFQPKVSPLPDIFTGLLLPGVIYWILGEFTGSYHPDWAIFAIGILISCILVHWMLSEPESQTDAFKLFALSLLVSVGVAIKVSFAVFAGLSWLFGILIWLQKKGGWRKMLSERHLLLAYILPAFAVITIWLFRGILISGYPLFPSSIAGLDVSWKIPITRLYYEQALIRGFARQVGIHWTEAIYGWKWLKPWYTYYSEISINTILITSILAIAGISSGMILRKRAHWQWFFLLVPLGSAVFWFVTAPAVRFSGSIFWVMLPGALVLIYHELNHRFAFLQWKGIPFLLLVCTGFFINYIDKNPINVNIQWFLPRWDIPRMDEYVLSNDYLEYSIDGITVYKADSWEMCFNHRIPCSSIVNTGLRLYKPGNIRAGFWIDPTHQYEMAPGLEGKLPIGAEIVWGLSYDSALDQFQMDNFFHIIIYSDKSKTVKALFTPRKLTRKEQQISSLPVLLQVNSIVQRELVLEAGKPIEIELPLKPGPNEFTVKEKPTWENYEADDEKNIKVILSPIKFR